MTLSRQQKAALSGCVSNDLTAQGVTLLEVAVPGRPTREYLLAKSRITIGRSLDCDVWLRDLGASRIHAVLEQTPAGTYLLSDSKSINGTEVNGWPVATHSLAAGDVITIASCTLRVRSRMPLVDIAAETMLLPSVPSALSVEAVATTDTSHAPAEGGGQQRVAGALAQWLNRQVYRIYLLAVTLLLMLGLDVLQSAVQGTRPSWLPANAVSWLRLLDLLWLAPLPLGIALWLGWFFWAEAARPEPEPHPVPWLRLPPGSPAASAPARLVVRICTRGDNIAVLRDSVACVYAAFREYATRAAPGPFLVQIVSEAPLHLEDAAQVVVVPKSYQTLRGSRFKARALTYLQENLPTQPADWHLYLDEESAITASLIAGAYDFIADAERRAQRAGRLTAKRIGQGGILYQGGLAFYRGADSLRTGDDLGRFRLQYALGRPIFGVHGSYLLVRGLEEQHDLRFDVGPRNSITEDAAWSLYAWARGYRFGWVRGYVYEQPPQRVMDFVKQRSRWLSGIRAVLTDRRIPVRYRATLLTFVALWQVSFLPLLVTLVALLTHVTPYTWERLPADLGWAAFVLAYLQGLDVQAGRSRPAPRPGEVEASEPPRQMRGIRRLIARILAWPLILGIFWYALLETWGVLYSLKPGQGFFVIQKPSLTPSAADLCRLPSSRTLRLAANSVSGTHSIPASHALMSPTFGEE